MGSVFVDEAGMTHDPLRWKNQLQYTAISDIGMRRTANQDSYAIELAADEETWRRRGHLFLVADGMGAHAAGELASKLAADTVPHLYFKHPELSAPESLKRAVVETNAEINRKGQANLDFHNMGTTCSVLTLLPQGAVIAHVGDSRVYRIRQGVLEQLTFDHSLVWEMRASGRGDARGELDAAIPRNVITRSLGPFADVKVDVEGPFPIEPGDTFMLCSDGLVGEVSDEELGPILASLSPDEAARALVDLANLRGGPDNITVVVCRVIGALSASDRAGAEPLTIGGRKPQQRSWTPFLWAVAFGCVAASGLMALLQAWPAAIGLGVIGLITLLVALLLQYGSDLGGTIVSGSRRFGRGPYTRTSAEPSKHLVDQLGAIIEELRMADEENSFSLDFGPVEPWLNQSREALSRNDSRGAMQTTLRSLCHLMGQLRDRRSTG